MATTASEDHDRGSLQVMSRVYNTDAERQFLSDEGVQPKEVMEAIEKQLVCVTNKPHGAKMRKVPKKCSLYDCFQSFQNIQKQCFLNL